MFLTAVAPTVEELDISDCDFPHHDYPGKEFPRYYYLVEQLAIDSVMPRMTAIRLLKTTPTFASALTVLRKSPTLNLSGPRSKITFLMWSGSNMYFKALERALKVTKWSAIEVIGKNVNRDSERIEEMEEIGYTRGIRVAFRQIPYGQTSF